MANLLVMRGELEEATVWYSSAYTQTRRAGMVWPAREHTQGLIDRARVELPEEIHDRAWREGAALSTDELVARRVPVRT